VRRHQRTMAIRASHVDEMMAARREREEQVNALKDYSAQNTKLGFAAKQEIDITSRRRKEHLARVQAEERMHAMIQESELAARTQERINDQNKKLAGELERRKAERERKERDIQRICEESEELRELERRLKVAYMNKERAAQHDEKQVLARMAREADQAIEDQMEVDRLRLSQAEYEKQMARRNVGLAQKAHLQQQILVREKFLIEAQEEAARDKLMVDAIVNKIEEEDRRDLQIREKRKEETRKLIKDYERQRSRELQEKMEAEAEEQKQIREHMQNMAAREEGIQKALAEKEELQAEMFAKLVEDKARVTAEENELQMLRDMLWEEEMEASRAQAEKDRLIKKEKSKEEMARANQTMLAAKAKQREMDAAEEAKLVNLMMEKFAKDEEQERQAELARVSRREQYKKEIEEQKSQRLHMYEVEKTNELAGVEEDKEVEEYRKAVVAEARRRLLEEHSKRLSGFLPKGTIQSQDELALVRGAA